jgi:hypothetical protein
MMYLKYSLVFFQDVYPIFAFSYFRISSNIMYIRILLLNSVAKFCSNLAKNKYCKRRILYSGTAIDLSKVAGKWQNFVPTIFGQANKLQ